MLGNPDSLAMSEVLIVSICGLAIVFLCLATLIVAIKLLSTLFQALHLGEKTAAPKKAAAPAAPKFDEETYAVLLSTVSDAAGLPLDKFRVVSITEVG